jgi:hypothetical protein
MDRELKWMNGIYIAVTIFITMTLFISGACMRSPGLEGLFL